ncbi:MAG: hypothetical protein Q7T13_01540 [Polaromonas sp.]|nr:hypothetical protein [Polaromonas sp.]
MGYRIPDHYTLYLRSGYYSEVELLALIDHIPLHAARVSGGKVVLKQSQTPADYWNQEYRFPAEGKIELFFSTLHEDSWNSPTYDAVVALLKAGIRGVFLELIKHGDCDSLTVSSLTDHQRLCAENTFEHQTTMMTFERSIRRLREKNHGTR